MKLACLFNDILFIAVEMTKENNLFCFVTGLNSVNWQCKEKKAPFHEFIEFNDNKKTLGQSNV